MAEDLKLIINIKSACKLPNVEKKRDTSDPYVKLTFKSKSVKSEYIESNNDPEWNETKELEIGSTALLPGDVLEAVIKDHEKLGSDRTMAQCKIPLKECLSNPSVEIKQPLFDAKNKKVEGAFLFLNLNYSGAKKGGGGGGGGGAAPGGAGAASGAGDSGGDGGGTADGDETGGDFSEPVAMVSEASEGGGALPDEGATKAPKVKESLRGTLPKKPMDYQVRVKIWEGRQLKGAGLKPIVKVDVGPQSNSTKVKASNNPCWGEVFFYNFKMIPVDLFDEVINFQVCDSKMFRSDAIIGSFKLDVGSVWDEDKHSILSKWIMLTDPNSDSGELMGYLKISANVLGAGDEAPPDNKQDGDDDDVESNLLRPAGTQLRPATFWIRLYHGVDIPQMDTGVFTGIKTFFTGGDKEEENKKLVDPFVIAKFAGKRVKSSVKYEKNNPEFNEQLQLKFNFPSMCQKLKLDLRDWDQTSGDDPIALGEILLSNISANGDQGFLPTFGPCWFNFYGAPREEGKSTFGGENEYLNKGKGDGCAFRGRILMEIGTVLDQKPEAAIVPIAEEQLLTITKYDKTRKWRCFAMFEEANMIADNLDEAITFEVSIGNFGNSLDPDSNPMPSTTPPCQAVFDGQFYHYVPSDENKPLVCVNCDFEDISFRLGVANMIEKLYISVEKDLQVLKTENENMAVLQEEEQPAKLHEVALLTIKLLDYLKNNLPRIISKVESIQEQHKGNGLDRMLNKYRIHQLNSFNVKAQTEYEKATEVQSVIEIIQDMVTNLKSLAQDPQISIPDIIIWMMEDTSRIAYVRIPVKDVFYNKDSELAGRFCSIAQNIILRYPGKKEMKEWRAPAQLRVKMWFGLHSDDNAFGQKTEAVLTTLAETLECESYSVMKFVSSGPKYKPDSPNFSDVFHKIPMSKEAFVPPPGWNFEGDWFISRDKSTEVNADEGLDMYTEDVFEQQGRYPGLSWQPDVKWVDAHSQEVTPRDEIVPPAGWAWESEDDGWAVDLERGVDEQGFEYCVDIDITGGWQPSEKPYHVWRRRRWVRPRIKVAESESDGLRAAPDEDLDPEAAWEYGKTYTSKFHKGEQKMDLKRRRRWHRNLKRTDPTAPPLFFFEFKEKDKMYKVSPRTFASFPKAHKYELRAYIYQARDLLSADDNGYSDPYVRVVIGNRSQRTETKLTTVNPTWNQTLIFKNLQFYDSPEHLASQPPPVVVEVFDYDSFGKDEYLGRVSTCPTVKVVPTQGKKAQLEWLPVNCFGESSGEILCAFELLLADPGVDLPFEPTRVKKNYIVPQGVAPILQRTSIEILCWGVRNLQNYQLMSIDKPKIEFEVGDMSIKSSGVIDIKRCPNFKTSVLQIETMLPIEEKYCPPMNIKVRDNRQFGRNPVVANHRIKSLGAFRIKPLELKELHEEDIVDAVPIVPPLFMGEKRGISRTPSETHLAVVAGAEQPPIRTGTSNLDVTIDVEDGTKTPSQDDAASHMTASTNLLNTFASGLAGRDKLRSPSVASLPEAKVIKSDTLDWWTKYYASHLNDPKMLEKEHEYIEAGGDILQILENELEEVRGLDSLNDFLRSFTLDQGKKSSNEEDFDFMGEFKGALVVYSLPADRNVPQPRKYFSQIPSGEVKEVVVRVYIVKATGLQPKDDNGKADPFLKIKCGAFELDDNDNYIPNTLDPVFGKMIEFSANLPVEKDLTISVWDWDMVGSNDLIGETVIDLEDRYLSKHRALCGLPRSYKIKGHNAWRDCETPTQILAWYCKRNNLAAPAWEGTTEVVVGRFRYELSMFESAPPSPIDEYGSDEERLALHVLNQFDLVKEHVERRSLCAPSQPKLDQGQVYMWVDMFPKEIGPPGEPVDISPRKTRKFFLRICIFDCFDTVLDETSLVGDTMSDVYVKGWVEGMEHDKQKTDVHYRCMDGHAMFNWRFVFEFNYDPSERQIVVKRKEHFWSLDETESLYPPRLNLEIWDNDLISADDCLGSIQLDLEKMCRPRSKAKEVALDQLIFDLPTDDTKKGSNRPVSLFTYRRFKGLWPMKRDFGKGDGPEMTGKLSMEIELVEEDEHAERACAKARDEPNANPVLEPPKRPATSFLWFTSPWATFKHIIWRKYKWYMIGTLVLVILILFLAMCIYQAPNHGNFTPEHVSSILFMLSTHFILFGLFSTLYSLND